jgi:hypothetical protein
MLSTTLTTGSSIGNTSSNSEANSFQAFFEQQQALEMKKKRKKQLQQMQQRPKTPTLTSHNKAKRSQSAQLVRSNSTSSPYYHNNKFSTTSPNLQEVKHSNLIRPQTAARSANRREHSYNNQIKTVQSRTSSSSPFRRSESRGNGSKHAMEEIHIESNSHKKKSSMSNRKLIDSSDDVSSNNFELDVSHDHTFSALKAQKKKFIKCVLREDVDLLVSVLFFFIS